MFISLVLHLCQVVVCIVKANNMTSSPVWDYFSTTVDASKAKCKICSELVSRGGIGKKATTTNMVNHLKSHHPAERKIVLSKRVINSSDS